MNLVVDQERATDPSEADSNGGGGISVSRERAKKGNKLRYVFCALMVVVVAVMSVSRSKSKRGNKVRKDFGTLFLVC